MKKENPFSDVCARIREKALANVAWLYADNHENPGYKAGLEMVETFTNPDNVAAFCKGNGIGREKFMALLMSVPYVFNHESIVEAIKEMDAAQASKS